MALALVRVSDEGELVLRHGRPDGLTLEAVQGHAEHSDWMLALEKDPQLQHLFPEDDELRGIGRTHRPSWLAFMLIGAATWHATYQGNPTVPGMLDSLRRALEVMAASAVGQRTEAIIYTALSLELPAGTAIETPFGLLRSVREGDELVVSQFRSGNHLPEHLAILETGTLQNLGVLPGKGTLEDQLPDLLVPESLSTSLAVLLSGDDEWTRPCEPVLSTRLIPVMGGISGGSSRDRVLEGPRLAAKDLQRVQHWCTRLAACRIPEVSSHRILSMMRRNAEHVDAFIDAVIVWENLFGLGDTQELSYRVSMNMARVLSDDIHERISLQKEIKGLYSLRSRVVHGGEHLEGIKSRETRMRAQGLTLTSLRQLIGNYPSLVGAKPDAFTAFLLGRG